MWQLQHHAYSVICKRNLSNKILVHSLGNIYFYDLGGKQEKSCCTLDKSY